MGSPLLENLDGRGRRISCIGFGRGAGGVLALPQEKPMEIPFQGQLDESMLRRSTVTALRPTRGRLLFIACWGLALVWSFIVLPLTHGQSLDLTLLIPVLVFVGLMLYLTFVWGPRKQMRTNKLAQGPRTGTIGEEGVHIETSYSKADFPWDVFTRAKIAKDLVLLYNSAVGSAVHPFPREFFASEMDWNGFVELVHRRIPLRAAQGWRGRTWIVFLIWLVIFVVIVFAWNVVTPAH
jgi:hypothetical protein